MDGNSEFHRLNVVDLCTGSQSSKPSWSLGKIADRILFFTKIPAPVRGIMPAILPRQFYQLLLLELGILYQDSCYQFFQGIRDCPCCICTSLYKSCTHGKEIPELMNDLINYPHWERAVMNFWGADSSSISFSQALLPSLGHQMNLHIPLMATISSPSWRKRTLIENINPPALPFPKPLPDNSSTLLANPTSLCWEMSPFPYQHCHRSDVMSGFSSFPSVGGSSK